MSRQYFSLVQVGQTATLNIYGDIASWGEDCVSAKNLSKQLDEMDGVSQIDVYINSYGGEVAEGLAIYNALKRKGKSAKVVTYCDGFACSIASVVFMAGSERKMSKSSLLMIHNAWTLGAGNAEQLRKMADDLEIITGASVEAYKEVATISEKKIRELMDAETWINPKDALKYGFATEILDEQTQNVSQNVKETLFNIVIAAKSGQICDFMQEEDNEEQQKENGENGAKNGENEQGEDEDLDNAENEEDPENGEDGVSDTENDEEDPENTEKAEDETEEKEEKPAEKLGGFFSSIFKI